MRNNSFCSPCSALTLHTHVPEPQWRSSHVSTPGMMAENASGLVWVCSKERAGTGGDSGIFPIATQKWGCNNLQPLCHPALPTVTDESAGSVCYPKTANVQEPIVVMRFQGLGCIFTHSFKSKENCLRYCWFYLSISVNYFWSVR